MTAGFTLKNGAAQLQELFGSVERRDFEDQPRVTAVEPPVAHALSRSDVREDGEPAFRAALEKRVARGTFEVTKPVGMLVAR